ncbi:MAG: hypothetical protein EHM61_07920 [Acidobacteria bacterium]|nr:MAG: hypothetical protein EHM61_07920 [Acidobacteriota bacterium]
MSRLVRSFSFFVLVFVLLLSSSQPVRAEAKQFPDGSYQAGPFTVTFKEGKFQVTIASGAGVTGTYKVSGEQVEFTDQEGEFMCPDAPGKYSWKLDGEKIVLTLIDDPCEGRTQALTSEPLKKKTGQ